MKEKRTILLSDFVNPLIAISIISALLSIIRYLPIPIGFLINDIWPIISNGEIQTQLYWGRLWGTMGGTNSAGNFFTILSFLSLSFYYFDGKRKYIFPFFLFSLCVLLSLSFTSIFSYLAGIVFVLRKKISLKIIISCAVVTASALFFISQNEVLNQIATKRIGANFSEKNRDGSILPENLQARIGYWKSFLSLSNDKELHFLYGFGPGGVRLQKNLSETLIFTETPRVFILEFIMNQELLGY